MLEATPAQASARSRPAAAVATKRLRPPAHVLPLVEYGIQGHYVVLCPTHGLLSLQPDTPAWFAWLATLSSFRFVGTQGCLTAHREELCQGEAAITRYLTAHQCPSERALLRLDGHYGTGAVLSDLAGFACSCHPTAERAGCHASDLIRSRIWVWSTHYGHFLEDRSLLGPRVSSPA